MSGIGMLTCESLEVKLFFQLIFSHTIRENAKYNQKVIFDVLLQINAKLSQKYNLRTVKMII